MASLIEALFSVLKEETDHYTTLLDMADNKKDVIIKGDVPSLQEITKREQELAGHILCLEKQRKQTLEDICLVLGKEPQNITINSLIESLQGEDKIKLKELNEKLTGILIKLQEENESIKVLLRQSLEFIDFTVNAVQSMSQNISNNTYEAKGNRYNNHEGRNFFDAKQ